MKVYERVRAHYDQNTLTNARELLVVALGFAVEGYAELASEHSEWEAELGLVQDMLAIWTSDEPHITEALAGFTLFDMHYDRSATP